MGTVAGAHVAIAGAGVFGLATALALARAGLRVTVFDPAALGSNASGVAAGMLAPASEALFDDGAAVHLALLRRARDLWPDFVAGLGIEIFRNGVCIEGEANWLAAVAARRRALGLPDHSAADGLCLDEDWRLDSRAALSALSAAAKALGVVFQPTGIADFIKGTLTLCTGATMRVDALVVATGASERGGHLAPETIVLSPIKGQILRLAGGLDNGPVLRGAGVYVCPDARPLVGATMEAGRDDLTPDPVQTAPLLSAAARLRPDLATASATIEVGVRAATPDGLPLVGWSARPGVILAVGARRNGWLLAPLVAGVVAAYLTDKDPGPDAARLDARRFDREPEADAKQG